MVFIYGLAACICESQGPATAAAAGCTAAASCRLQPQAFFSFRSFLSVLKLRVKSSLTVWFGWWRRESRDSANQSSQLKGCDSVKLTTIYICSALKSDSLLFPVIFVSKTRQTDCLLLLRRRCRNDSRSRRPQGAGDDAGRWQRCGAAGVSAVQ
jgi:hypothetical protein